MPIEDIDWEFDDETLREIIRAPEQFAAIRAELTEELDQVDEDAEPARVAELAGQRAVLSRALGDLDLALGDGERAVGAAERSGDAKLLTVTRARLAHVHQWRGEYADADRLFARSLAEADAPGFPAGARAAVYQHAGKNQYDQQHYAEAERLFAEALRLREGGDPSLVASSRQALAAARRHLGS